MYGLNTPIRIHRLSGWIFFKKSIRFKEVEIKGWERRIMQIVTVREPQWHINTRQNMLKEKSY